MSADFEHIPLQFERCSPEAQKRRAREFYELMRKRRSVRFFSPEAVPLEIIKLAIRTAGSAPSGANLQPWRFVVVSDPEVKHKIRMAAEEEERENYERRFPEEWLHDLARFGTDWHKEFLDIAPYLIVVFRMDYGMVEEADGTMKKKHYYVSESVGIATGLLLAALHNAGLATLTHTPSPMRFLGTILSRPQNEKPYLLIPVGYPAGDATVPNIERKRLEEIMELIG